MLKRGWSGRSRWLLAQVAGATMAVALWIASEGAILHDEVSHFLFAKNAWHSSELLLDTWGRVGTTVAYMVPALGGFQLARAGSLVLALLTVVVTTRIARSLGVKLFCVVPIFLWFQPWFSESAFTVVTEVPFSLALAVGTLAVLRQRHTTAALAFGVLPLIRHEGILLTLLWCTYEMGSGRWKSSFTTWLPWLVYNGAHFAVVGSWPYEVMLEPRPTDFYGSGSWFHFVPRVVANAGLPVILLALVGTRRLLRRHATFVWPYAVYFLTHVILFRFGLFKSGGYSIFLLPLAPVLAVVATMGMEEIRHACVASGTQRRWRQVLAASIVVTALYAAFTVDPHPLGGREIALREAATWLRSEEIEDARVYSSDPFFHLFADLGRSAGRPWGSDIDLEDVPSDALFVWERRYLPREGVSHETMASAPDRWEEVWSSDARDVVVFRRR